MNHNEPEKEMKQETTAEAPSSEEVASLSELEQLKEQLLSLEDKYLRTLAETENSRKRSLKEKESWIHHAKEHLILDFLLPIDSFEHALHFADASNDEVKNWAMGFSMILSQMKQVLEQHNIRSYESKGRLFDPHFHEAIEILYTDEYPSGTVVEELVRGYMMGDRVIRVARVKVAKPIEKKEGDSDE